MTRDSSFEQRIARWQTTLKWLLLLVFLLGLNAGRTEMKIQALEKERDDWKATASRIENKIDTLNTNVSAVLPLVKDHLEKDRILKPSDLNAK